jgi:two-component system LytT family response regulator
MKTIIIEDDILNIDLLQSLIQRYFPKINITAICNDVDTAIEAVHREHPELIFLDINLKDKTAFDILRVIDVSSPKNSTF